MKIVVGYGTKGSSAVQLERPEKSGTNRDFYDFLKARLQEVITDFLSQKAGDIAKQIGFADADCLFNGKPVRFAISNLRQHYGIKKSRNVATARDFLGEIKAICAEYKAHKQALEVLAQATAEKAVAREKLVAKLVKLGLNSELAVKTAEIQLP